jgi:hypothetical protein
MIANLTWMAGVSYGVPMNPHVAMLLRMPQLSRYLFPTYLQHRCIIGLCIRDLKSEGASGFSKYYKVGKGIPDLSMQQQGTEPILQVRVSLR